MPGLMPYRSTWIVSSIDFESRALTRTKQKGWLRGGSLMLFQAGLDIVKHTALNTITY